MGFWDAVKDYGPWALGGVGGLAMGAAGSDKVKEMLFGGGATKGLDTVAANSGFVNDYARGQLSQLGGRAAPTATSAQLGQAQQLATGPQDQVRADQRAASGYLQGIMQGNRAGAGELAVNRQVSGAQAAQQAMARMARGSNAALMGRQAMRSAADIGLMGAGQAAQAQMADQQMASGQLAGLLAQTRGQDLDIAGQNAQLAQQRMLQQGAFDQQTGLANQSAMLQQRGMNDAAMQGYLQQLAGLDQAAWMRELQKRQLAAQDKGMLPGLLQAGGNAAITYATGGMGAPMPGR